MGDKFGRNYNLYIGTTDGTVLTVSLPFTIEFDITRNILGSSNNASIRIYNLSPINRSRVGFNLFNQQEFRIFRLDAGYGNALSTMFSGNIKECGSSREGTNFITQVECFDGGFATNTSFSNITFPPGTPNAVIIAALIADLAPTVVPGTIDIIPGVSTRGTPYSGPTVDLLNTLTNGCFFIDDGKANVLLDKHTRPNTYALITDESGIIGIPVKEQNVITLDILFEPRLIGGQYIVLLSETYPLFNGAYRTNSVKHRGMISDAVCGECITTLSMTSPALLPGVIV